MRLFSMLSIFVSNFICSRRQTRRSVRSGLFGQIQRVESRIALTGLPADVAAASGSFSEACDEIPSIDAAFEAWSYSDYDQMNYLTPVEQTPIEGIQYGPYDFPDPAMYSGMDAPADLGSTTGPEVDPATYTGTDVFANLASSTDPEIDPEIDPGTTGTGGEVTIDFVSGMVSMGEVIVSGSVYAMNPADYVGATVTFSGVLSGYSTGVDEAGTFTLNLSLTTSGLASATVTDAAGNVSDSYSFYVL
jgi:hypothetical protein